ncbi:hypothetical protein RvY_06318-2 [Ramazzottius varieornatus]|uniref:Receptor ligand binding region domain-containing protein n=1 Tax=Ramazzottius varieornatus TaxID=947166 RepID=A0A1D1V1N2_RAMVA|nr:hypothetical protein RvY_06318-2 [Ramazzottius varieornatus]
MRSVVVCLSFICLLLKKCYPAESTMGSPSVYTSYGNVFPPLDPSSVPKLSAENSTVVTLCELWEDDGIPVTPGIDLALQRIGPHFALKNMTFRLLRHGIAGGCGDESVLAVGPALVDMHLHQAPNGCQLLIGPSCSETMSNIRGLIEHWNIPVVTSGASGIKFADKQKTEVLTRFGYTQEDVSLFLIRILDHFNWTNVAFLYDVDTYATDFQSSFQQVLQSSRLDIFKRIEFTKVMLGQNSDKQWLKDTLVRSSERSRVFILAALARNVYQIMVAASELGKLNSEYVYITTNLIEAHRFSDLFFFNNMAKSDPVRAVHRLTFSVLAFCL